MLKSHKMASYIRATNLCVCSDKRQLFCPDWGISASKFITCWTYFKQAHCSLLQKFCFITGNQSNAEKLVLVVSLLLGVCFSHVTDFTLILVSNFPPMEPNSERKNDSKKILNSAQEGKATTFPLGLHVQLSGIFRESNVNRVTTKPITKFFFSFFF